MLGEYRRRVLPNGLRVLGVEHRALHAFVCSVYVRLGPRYEPPHQRGLSHFLEHMIVQGSENFPDSRAIMRGIEDLGGVVDAGTYPEYVSFVFGAHRKHWRRVMEIAADVLMRPLFDEEEIEQEKQIVTQEILQHRDRRGRNISAAELAHCLIFDGELREAGTRGDPEVMAAFDRQAVQAHYERYFTGGNAVLCLAGGFEFEEVLGEVAEGFSRLPAEDGPPGEPLAPAPRLCGRARAFYRSTEALPVAEAVMAHTAYALADHRFDAARAASYLLGGGLSSRLFSRVREELGLVYDVHAAMQGYTDAGTIDVALSVGVENLVPAVEAVLGVLREAAEDGFEPEELERYKETARCGMDMLCDRATHLADWFGRQELLLGPARVLTPEQYVARQEALTLEALQAVLRDVTAEHGVAFVVVGPYEEAERRGLRELFPAEEVRAEGDEQ